MNLRTTGVLAVLRLSLLLCGCLLVSFGTIGCNQQGSNHQATTATPGVTPPKPKVAVMIELDLSGSITSYPGGLKAIEEDYQKIAQAYVKAIVSEEDVTHIEIHAFVKSQETLFSGDVEKWEDIREKIHNFIHRPTFPATTVNETRYSDMLDSLHVYCVTHDQHVCALVLSDGHPDDTGPKGDWAPIKDSVAAFALDPKYKGNLVSLLVAPVAEDMENRWRDKMTEALAPLKGAAVTGGNDYADACAAALNTVKGGK